MLPHQGCQVSVTCLQSSRPVVLNLFWLAAHFSPEFFCGTPKAKKIFENSHSFAANHLASSNNIACISHFSKEICLIGGKSDSKSQGRIFGGTPRRSSRQTSVPRHTG